MKQAALRARLIKIAEDAKFEAVAVALYDYESGREFAHQGDRFFHAASTIKVAILLALYKLAEEGRVRLGDPLHVRNRFRSLINGKVFRVAANRDGDSEVHGRLGRSMRVGQLARAMITRSSNLATNLLLDYVGLDAVQGFITDAKIEGVEVARGVEDSLAFEKGINNRVTAWGLVRLFRLICEDRFFRIITNTVENRHLPKSENRRKSRNAPIRIVQSSTEFGISMREQVLEILHAQEFNSMIPEGLPKDAQVAHKTGEISTVCHDAGIVFLRERKPYVVAVLTEMPASVEVRSRPIAEMARAVYEALETT